MTKDNLIFLGACSLLAAEFNNCAGEGEVSKLVNDALKGSKRIYEQVHGGDTTITPKTEPIEAWVVEVKLKDWYKSYNEGLCGKIFPSKKKAEEAMRKFGSPQVPYRAVLFSNSTTPSEPPTPVKEVYYIVEKRFIDTGNGWLKSYVFRDEYSTEKEADMAIDIYLSNASVYNRRYRVTRKER